MVDNKVLVLEDWQSFTINDNTDTSKVNKGYEQHWDNFFRTIKGEDQPLVPLERAFDAMKASFEANKQIKKK